MQTIGAFCLIVAVILIGGLLIFSQGDNRRRHWMNKAEAEQYLTDLDREMTGTYTCEELQTMKQEAREAYNTRAADMAFWHTVDNTYIDYDGQLRTLGKE